MPSIGQPDKEEGRNGHDSDSWGPRFMTPSWLLAITSIIWLTLYCKMCN